MDEIYYGLIS